MGPITTKLVLLTIALALTGLLLAARVGFGFLEQMRVAADAIHAHRVALEERNR